MNKDTFFKYEENRALSGYKSAWLVKLQGNDKFSLVGLTETVPYVFGDKENFEFDILQSPTKGQVEGKDSIESQDIEVLHHRDNAYRYGKLEGQTLEFMSINSEFVGYTFKGTLAYKPTNAEADVNRATVTITPVSAQKTPILNARPYIMDTLCIEGVVPETVKVNDTVDLAVKQSSAIVSVTAKTITGTDNKETEATSVEVSIEGSKATFLTEGLYALTVSAEGFASWTTTVYVDGSIE